MIRIPPPALAARIRAAGETGPLLVEYRSACHASVTRADGSETSEVEQRRVAGLVAADDAEPFT